MLVLIFVAMGIFCFGLIMSANAKEQRAMDMYFGATMLGMIMLIALAFVVTLGGYK